MARILVLASASPRRVQLLETLSLPFLQDVADVDEWVSPEAADPAGLLAVRKAQAVAVRHPDAVIIGADTLVFCAGRRLGKPEDEAEAAEMLRQLAGNWHEVRTGLCCLDTRSGEQLCHSECTRVHMAPLTGAEIAAYIATGEPMDKAGAYGMQGTGGAFIDRIEGSPTNVIGLPVSVLRDMLKTFLIIPSS